ncbi:hypothetical protein GN958_ATG00446 [Phytophthora infestans]|uniref:Uncharacterized protein n=1 Tax=Phytophthora infestans TaxID=4787 RepID=A0A8S9VGN8_PHYIN|nr:hypothetical protein GN958_ATG00446 [Phytophthora infestans]
MAATEAFAVPLACSQLESRCKVKMSLASNQFETHGKVARPVKAVVNSVVKMQVKVAVRSKVWGASPARHTLQRGPREDDSTYESRDDLSQNAVNRAFDVPPAVDEPDHDIGMGAFQRLLSEAEPDAHVRRMVHPKQLRPAWTT